MKKIALLSFVFFAIFSKSFSLATIEPFVFVVKQTTDSTFLLYEVNYYTGEEPVFYPYCAEFKGTALSINFSPTYDVHALSFSNGIVNISTVDIQGCEKLEYGRPLYDAQGGGGETSIYRKENKRNTKLLTSYYSNETKELNLAHDNIDDFVYRNGFIYYLSYDSLTKTQFFVRFDHELNEEVDRISFQSEDTYLKLSSTEFGTIFALSPSNINNSKVMKIRAFNSLSYEIDTIKVNSSRINRDLQEFTSSSEAFLIDQNRVHVYNTGQKTTKSFTLSSADSIDKVGYQPLNFYDFPTLPSMSYYVNESLMLAISSESEIGNLRINLGHKDSTMVLFGLRVFANVENEMHSNISIYPNPAQNFITFDGIKDFSSIKIITSYGEVLMKKEILTSEVDISELASGIYILQAENNTGTKHFKFQKE